MNPFKVVEDFEAALCEYTGAPYAVTTTSCTMALLLACAWFKEEHAAYQINIPKLTYVGVAQSILNAGHRPTFRDDNWSGEYRLTPSPIWDSARRFTSGMYRPGQMQCVSFHWSKTLGIGQGGAILLDGPVANEWLRRCRFDGRREGVPPSEDEFITPAFHAYMMPRDAAEGLSRLAVLPKDNSDLPWDDYPDLSQMEIFK